MEENFQATIDKIDEVETKLTDQAVNILSMAENLNTLEENNQLIDEKLNSFGWDIHNINSMLTALTENLDVHAR